MITKITSIFARIETNSRYQYALLAIITLLAAVLRFYKLGEWSFWIDEIYTIERALGDYGSLKAVIQNIPPGGKWIPPSFILTGGALNLLGTSEWSARLVSAIIGVISIPVLFFPIKRIFNPGVALIATMLLAVSPWHIFWSQNARFYTSLMLLYSLALFAFFFGMERDRPVYFLLSIFLLYLAASEREFALFMVPVVVCYLLLIKLLRFESPPGLRTRNMVLLSIPIVALIIYDIFSLIITGSSIAADVAKIFAGQMNHSPVRLMVSIIYRLGLPLLCLGSVGGVYLLFQKKRAGALSISAAWAPPLILLVMALFAFTVDRYVFVSLPFWIILGSVTTYELLQHRDRLVKILSIGILILLVGDSFSQDVLYYSYQNGNRPDWRGAFALVNQEKKDGDIIFSTRPEMGSYYLDEKVNPVKWADPNILVQDGIRAWFIIDEESGWETPGLREWIINNSELVDFLEVSMPGKNMNITIYLYDPARTSNLSVINLVMNELVYQ